jgi:uncharacterized repeat protein (TIGR03803 family)
MSCTTVKRLIRAELRNFHLASFALVSFLLITAALSSAQAMFTNLFDFDGTDGQNPQYVYLVQGTDGQLYGTAQTGGDNGAGTLYKITTSGTFTQLYTFCSQTNCADGANPYGGLVLAPNGNFYGTASDWGLDTEGACDTGIYGCGTIFEITPAGVLTVLHTFSGPDGFSPYANMTLGSDGNLYGTTLFGGANLNAPGCSGIGCGTVFKITPQGKFTSLYSFANGSDGANPIGRLFQGNNGNFYGTTIQGTVFEITPGGKLTTLYSFTGGSDGAGPYGGVVQAANGTIYGTTAGGGANSYGTLFKLVGKKLTTLYNFCSLPNCADGNYPYGGLIQASDGNFYGTTNGGGLSAGTAFEFIPPATLNTLYSFCSQAQCSDGALPYGGGLLQATDGNFYGTTWQGGISNALGTIFRISNGLGPFVQSVASSAKVGVEVTILGTNLTGATAVSFNGTAATFKVNSRGTAITTSVPAGATTGPINVVTPNGTLASNATFKIVPQVKSFTPSSGSVGTVVTITGVSLTQATKVTFGGVAATSFTVNSDTQVTATVPSGAKTGKIVITTPGGTASSSTDFTVT